MGRFSHLRVRRHCFHRVRRVRRVRRYWARRYWVRRYWARRFAAGLGVLAVLATAGCGDGEAAPRDATTPPSGQATPPGQAAAQTYLSVEVTEDGRPRQLPPGVRIRLTFHRDAITAEAGCNTLSGKATFAGGRLSVSDLSTTDRYCGAEHDATEQWLSGLLDDRPTWRYDEGALVLTTASTRLRLTT